MNIKHFLSIGYWYWVLVSPWTNNIGYWVLGGFLSGIVLTLGKKSEFLLKNIFKNQIFLILLRFFE